MKWHTTPDGRAALSQAHGPQVIGVLRLPSGQFAIYNDIRELQGIVATLEEWPPACWSPRVKAKPPVADLYDLGIL